MAFSLEDLKKKKQNSSLIKQEQELSERSSRSLNTLKKNLGIKEQAKPSDIERKISQMSVGILNEVRDYLKANKTELIFFIDKSTSCKSSAPAIIKGFNELIAKEKRSEYTTRITTILFGDEFETLHYREDINRIPSFNYVPYGNTLLFDTLKPNLEKLKHDWLNDPSKAPKVLVTIMTDGDDNISMRNNQQTVRNIISECKKLGWEFLFLAANQNAYNLSSALGIPTHTTSDFNANSQGFYLNFKAISEAIDSLRKEGTINPNWSNIIKENNLRLENGNEGPTLRLGGRK